MLKEDILYELETHRDIPISGQELADRFSVSRNAVWKVMKSLKEEGYSIISTRNKGYVLEGSSDVLSKEGILAALDGEVPGLEVYLFQEVDSTNNEAKRMLASGFAGNALLVAESQTMGRGRRGKSFYSPAGTGLYMSLILQTEELKGPLSMLTIVTACGVLRALQNEAGIDIKVKWVNDLFVGNKKAGGILSEAITDLESGKTEAVVIGIGINVTEAAFPEELKEVATVLHTDIPRNCLIASIVKELYKSNWTDPVAELPFYRANSLVLGQKVWYDEEEVLAEAIDESGGLVICHGDGRREGIRGGNIRLIRNQ